MRSLTNSAAGRLSLVLMLAAISAASVATAAGSAARRRAPAYKTYRLAVAGDIACAPGEVGAPPDGQANGADSCQQQETAREVASLHPDGVAIPGDVQYNFGRLDEFLGSFDPTWGIFKRITYPAPGNHEYYDDPGGHGYFDYFDGAGRSNGAAGRRGQGYYSVNLNRRWHLITLNSNCTAVDPNGAIHDPVPCRSGSPQERWLRHDLASHRGMCVIAQWHHPLYTSGPTQADPNDRATRSFWRDLYRAHATFVMNGHDHGYERFAPMTGTGRVDRVHGLREFVLGTGGKSLFGPPTAHVKNSQAYNDTAFGVTIFTLHPRSFDWRFYPEPVPGNGSFTDHGSARCNA